MNRFVLSIITIAAVLAGIVFLFGIRASERVDTTFFARMEYSPEYLFDFITDVSQYPTRKQHMESLEVLERTGQRISMWRENYTNGSWREYQIVQQKYPTFFEVEIINSSDNHLAVISYNLNETNDFTEIVLAEKGTIENTFRRGLRRLSGDDSFLEAEIKWLRVAIQDELINRP
jgi:hypothetical protein